MKLSLGILDIGFCSHSKDPNEIIQDTISMASIADDIGFSRYWLGEHHGINFAWRNPDIIVSLIANNTTRIIVGAAGVLINYQNPFSIATNYKLLNGIFRERIDLGLSSGFAPSEISNSLSSSARFISKYLLQCLSVRCFMEQSNVLSETPLPPYTEAIPRMWLLGSSVRTIDMAIEHKFSVSISLCHYKMGRDKLATIRNYIKENRRRLHESEVRFNFLIDVGAEENDNDVSGGPAFSSKNFVGDLDGCAQYISDLSKFFDVDEFILRKGDSTLETFSILCTGLAKRLL